jgi:hypothetical protein
MSLVVWWQVPPPSPHAPTPHPVRGTPLTSPYDVKLLLSIQNIVPVPQPITSIYPSPLFPSPPSSPPSPLLRPVDHAWPLTPPRSLVLRMDSNSHSFRVGGYTACNAHHLARTRATKVLQYDWEYRVHVRHWGRYTQTPFHRRVLYHGGRIHHHSHGGTVVKARSKV